MLENASLPQLPEGWSWRTLNDACEKVQDGTHFSPKIQFDTWEPGRYLYITAKNIKDSGIDLSNVTYVDEETHRDITKRCNPQKGDVLLTKDGVKTGVVTVNQLDEEFSLLSSVAQLRPKNNLLSPFFLKHYLSSPIGFRMITGQMAGTAIKRIILKRIKSTPVPIAPLPEQERIVAKIEETLTQLEAGVTELRNAKTQLKRYRAAVLKSAVEGELTREWRETHKDKIEPAEKLLEKIHQMEVENTKRAGRLWGAGTVPELTDEETAKLPAGWVWCKVQDLGPDPNEVVQVGPMSMRSNEFEEAGVPVLNVGCVQWGYFNEDKLNYLPETKAEKFDRYRIKPGDVLFTRSGTVGRCAVAKDYQNNWLMTFHLLRVRPDSKVCKSEYLRAVFEGASHIRRQTREASIGTTRAGFNTRLLAELDVPLPPLEEQDVIIQKVERRLSVADEIEKELEESLVRAERLRSAVLRSAFEGRLV